LQGPGKRKVLITGGAGFIGCALGRRLCDASDPGFEVYAMDNLHPQVHASPGRPLDLDGRIHLLPVDVTSRGGWDVTLKLVRPDLVVHLAAETGTGQSLMAATRHGLVNVVGTTRMLDAMGRHDIRPQQLLLSSSRAVYGEGAWAPDGAPGSPIVLPPIRAHEDLARGRWEPWAPAGARLTPQPHAASRTPARPANVYAATKLAQENLCSAWAAATGTALSVLRLQNVYGPGQSLTNSYTGIVTLFARIAAEKGQIEVYEDGEIVRDFVYIDDVVAAFLKAIELTPAAPRLLDIGSGEPLTVLALARLIAEMHGAPAPIVTAAFRDGDVRAAFADIQEAEAELGWHPRQPLVAGLQSLFRHIDAAAAC
jgi:dTDP-L-rhamnose 4-epimerase